MVHGCHPTHGDFGNVRGVWPGRKKLVQLPALAHYQPDQFLSVANRQRNETPSAELTTAFPTLLKIRRPLKACGFKSLSGHSFVSQRVGVDEVEIGLIELRLGWVGGLAFWLAHWVLDSPTGKSGPVPMGQISPQKRNGVVVGYSVYLGVDENGRRVRRFFAERLHGERFLAERNATPIPIGELWDRKAEILYNLERLRPMGTSLTDAVTFYLSNNGSSLGQKKLSELVDDFLREKLQVGRSPLRPDDETMLWPVRQTCGRGWADRRHLPRNHFGLRLPNEQIRLVHDHAKHPSEAQRV